MSSILEVNNLSFAYSDDKAPILTDVNFKVEKGDFVGIIGSNGSGKSTLIKLILGILPGGKGKIKIDGKDISEKNALNKVGYVSQKAASFNSDFPATAQEIVSLNLYNKIGLFKRIKKSHKLSTLEALDMVGMKEYANRKLGKMSGGQQQRVFIARVLVNNPEIMFLDEPTVGIDTASVKSVMELIHSLNKKGITIIMTSHDLPSILNYANKILYLDDNSNLKLYDINEFMKLGGHHHC